MNDQPILSISQKNISKITFNRPEKRNAFNFSLLKDLKIALLEVQNTPKVHCLILTGSGDKAFSAGADLKERETMDNKKVFKFLDEFRETLSILESLPMPVIAVLNGDAYGGGLEIALACDIRLGREGDYFGLTETKLGIIPGAGGTQRLSRLIGISKAKELIFLGERIEAKIAKEYGILNRCFPRSTFSSEVDEFIEELLLSAPISLRYAKEAIDRGYDLKMEKALNLEREMYLRTLTTNDRQEGLRAFKEKRKPLFKGE